VTRRARRTLYPTSHHVGPYRLAKIRHAHGYVIVDDRTGRAAWTEPHPITGRPRAVLVGRITEALRIAAQL
jgi:hypothetical protein